MIWIVLPEEEGMLISALLLRHAEGIPIWAIKESLKARDVRVNGERTNQDRRLSAGDEIKAYFPQQVLRKKLEIGIPILYEDECIVVVEKPQGISCINDTDPASGDTAMTRAIHSLQKKGENVTLKLCHRLDVHTGGLLMFAKSEEAYQSALTAFRDRTIEKKYTCLVKGCPKIKEETLKGFLRKDAAASKVSITDYPCRGAVQILTHYRVLESAEISRLEVTLITGRTHQIRAHLAHIGYPIIGDDKYGDRQLNKSKKTITQRLWATTMEFKNVEGVLSYLNGRTIRTNCPF